MAKIKGSIFEKLTPILVMTSIALAFLVGILWQKVSNLEGGGGVAGAGAGIDRFAAMQEIQHNDDGEIEHAAA